MTREVIIEDMQTMFYSIVSGPKQFPGIYIETVRAGGLAENYQLEVGDQIMEVNGKSFQDIKHKEAIVELKGSKELNMVIKKHAVSQLSLSHIQTLCDAFASKGF